MSESVIAVVFDVESEAYQAMTELRKQPVMPAYVISQGALLTRRNGTISVKDTFDVRAGTADDTRMGGLIGSLVGVIGGPVGMLFYGSMGALIGSTIDTADNAKSASVLERVAQGIGEGQTAILLMAQEGTPDTIDKAFDKFSVTISKHDAAEVEAEMEEAKKIQKELEKEARKKMHQEKTADQKAKIKERREKIRNHFDEVKAKFSK